MPLEALSAKARLMVPVGAMDSRWLLRRPCFLDQRLDSRPAGAWRSWCPTDTCRH